MKEAAGTDETCKREFKNQALHLNSNTGGCIVICENLFREAMSSGGLEVCQKKKKNKNLPGCWQIIANETNNSPAFSNKSCPFRPLYILNINVPG